MIKESFKFFFNKFIRKHVRTLFLIFILSIFTLLFSFISPLLIRSLVDNVFVGRVQGLFIYIILGIIVMYIVSAISSYFNSYVAGKLSLVLLKEVSESIFNAVQFSSLKSSQTIKVGDMITRIMGNSQIAINIPVRIIPSLFMSVVSIIVPFAIMLTLNYKLAIIVMCPVVLFALSSAFFGKRMEKIQKSFLNVNASIYSFLKENLSIILLVKVFNLESWSQNRFNNEIDNYYGISLNYTKVSSLNSSMSSLILGVPVVLLITFGGYMVIGGTISLGTFTAFLSYTSIFFSPISQLSSIWTSYKSSLPAFDRLKEIYDMEPETNADNDITVKNGVITFENVWFSYDNRTILKEFNATFIPGLNYIVGDNGTGKSTVLKLICSLYPADKGNIKIDGHDINEIKRNSLIKNVSMIFSDPYLFDGTIYENIGIGNLEATKEEIIGVSKLVKIHDFIESTLNKYDTQVGENGLMLSSGEKQKIALARAILKDSPIILLDEVTKSIDKDSRDAINEVILNLMAEKTVIIVTHDSNEININSNIICLDDGGVDNKVKPVVSPLSNAGT